MKTFRSIKMLSVVVTVFFLLGGVGFADWDCTSNPGNCTTTEAVIVGGETYSSARLKVQGGNELLTLRGGSGAYNGYGASLSLSTNNTNQLFYLGTRTSMLGNGTDESVGFYVDINGTGGKRLDFVNGGIGGNTIDMTILPEGYVGIGTTSPDFLLDIEKTETAAEIPYLRVYNPYNSYGADVGIRLEVCDNIQMNLIMERGDGGNDAQGLRFEDGDGDTLIKLDTYKNNVGIGATSPSEKLEVNGTVKATAFIGDGSGLTNVGSFSQNGDDTYFMGGNVGVGTDDPDYLSDVQMDFGDTVGVALRVANTSSVSSGTPSTRLLFGSHTNGGRDGGAIDVKNNTTGGDDMSMAFWVRDNANTLQERLRIDSAGNVGIGTTSPKMGALTSGMALSLQDDNSRPVLEFGSKQTADESLVGVVGFLNTDNTDANGNFNRFIAQIFGATETSDANAGKDSGGHLIFRTKAEAGGIVEQMRIDSKGNVGIGNASLEPWNSSYVATQIGGTGSISSTLTPVAGNEMRVMQNAYRASGGSNRIVEDEASNYVQTNGTHIFRVAPSAASDSAITWTTAMTIDNDGHVGIGCTNPQTKLAVDGTITAKEVNVKADTAGWCDYVFEDDYKLPSLEDVETHIKEKKHLPEIPSAKEIEEDGLNMAGMMALQMKKIEELTLYMIEMNKKYSDVQKENEQLKARLDTLEKVN